MVIAFLRKITLSPNSWYRGYVGFKNNPKIPNSMMSKVNIWDNYEDSLDSKIDVHKGITYDGNFLETTSIIPLTDIPKDWYTYRCVGFDLYHFNDEAIALDFDYAKAEALHLKEQIEEMLRN